MYYTRTMLYFIDTEFLEDGFTIDPISIGIVAEDGREYYAEFFLDGVNGPTTQRVSENSWLMQNVWPNLTCEWKTRAEIADEIRLFIRGNRPEFWAYCGAYDWVLLNQIYGSMVMHPSKWPYYCNDIAQYATENRVNRRTQLPVIKGNQHNALDDARWTKAAYDEITAIRTRRILALRSSQQ